MKSNYLRSFMVASVNRDQRVGTVIMSSELCMFEFRQRAAITVFKTVH